MASSTAVDVLWRAFEVGSVPAWRGRCRGKMFRDNLSMTQLQHKQNAISERFWRSAPESALLSAISGGTLTRAGLQADASTVVAVTRKLPSVVAALDDRRLLAPAGDIAAIQALFDRAVEDALHYLLTIATYTGRAAYRFEVEKVLLGRYPAINPGANHSAVIQAASRAGDAAMVRLLLADARVDPAAGYNEAIGGASSNGHTEVVRLLLADSRVDPAAGNNFAIWYACYHGHTEVARLLLADERVDPRASNNCAIRMASQHGHIDVVRLLIADARVDPAAVNNHAIRLASLCGRTDVVRLLLADARVDPTVNDNGAIREASKRGHTDVVQLLLADPRVTVDPAALASQQT